MCCGGSVVAILPVKGDKLIQQIDSACKKPMKYI